jgi:P-type conjugative transfer ATPase TrbB
MTNNSHQKPEAVQRGARMLRTALGPAIARFLEDPAVVEVMLNPDGRIWIDRLSEGLSDTGETLLPADGERIMRLVAHHVGTEVHARSPRVSAELPETGERFEGLLPPVVAAPAFAIRKPAVAVFTLDDYVRAGIMRADQADTLREAVAARANILVAGGTSTGKTTLTNALLAEVAKTQDRVVIIEDTRELQCAAPNLVSMRTKEGVVTLSDLVRSSLRLRPARADRRDDRPCGRPLRPRLRAPARRTRPRRRARPGRGLPRHRSHPQQHRRQSMIRTIMRARRTVATVAAVAYVNLILVPAAHASGSSMPWEAPLQKILQSIEGPVAKIVAVIIIIIIATGLALAFGDTSGGFRKLIQIVFGLSIAFAASSFFLSFFSFGGGALV